MKPQMHTDTHRLLRTECLLVAGRWALVAAFRWLRAVLEDDAYERFLEARGQRLEAGLSPAEFYRRRLEHKYSRPSRCC